MAFPINPVINDTYVDPNGQKYVYDGRGWKVTVGAALSNVLPLTNTTPYTPTEDYHPATKKYVDDNSGGAEEPTLSTNTLTVNGASTEEITITNYDSAISYIVESLNEAVVTASVTGNTVNITGLNVDGSTVVRVSAYVVGVKPSNWVDIAVTNVNIPIVADDATVESFSTLDNIETNIGWSLV